MRRNIIVFYVFGIVRRTFYSEEIASKIDSEIHRIITDAYNKAKKIITENMDKLNLIVDYLVAYEIMDEDQFNAVFAENCNMETLEKMREEKNERIRVANEKRREELKVNEEKKEESKDSDEKEDVVPH